MRPHASLSRLLPSALLLLVALVAGADAGFFSWWPWSKQHTESVPKPPTIMTEAAQQTTPTTTLTPPTSPATTPTLPVLTSGSTPVTATAPVNGTAAAPTPTPPSPAPVTTPPASVKTRESSVTTPLPGEDPTLECLRVDDMATKKMLMATLRLRYYHGTNPTDNVVVELHDAEKLVNSLRWRHNGCTVLFAYGFQNSKDQPEIIKIIRAYGGRSQYNFLLLDWSALTGMLYPEAVAYVPHVGVAVARALGALQDAGATLCQLVGYGVGAHLAGHINRRMKDGFKQVVGLDPAQALFDPDHGPCEAALNASDAACVSTVHTAWDGLDTRPLAGHLAFLPHGLQQPQPTCGHGDAAGPCGRERALALWAEAVRSPKALVGRHCSSWQSFSVGLCSANPIMQMRHCDGLTGRFYLRINSEEPFGLGLPGTLPVVPTPHEGPNGQERNESHSSSNRHNSEESARAVSTHSLAEPTSSSQSDSSQNTADSETLQDGSITSNTEETEGHSGDVLPEKFTATS